jgi:hypothetical protein
MHTHSYTGTHSALKNDDFWVLKHCYEPLEANGWQHSNSWFVSLTQIWLLWDPSHRKILVSSRCLGHQTGLGIVLSSKKGGWRGSIRVGDVEIVGFLLFSCFLLLLFVTEGVVWFCFCDTGNWTQHLMLMRAGPQPPHCIVRPHFVFWLPRNFKSQVAERWVWRWH